MALEGKLVLVTGGASGIGRAVCVVFAAEGASIIACDVDMEGTEETVKSLQTKNDFQRHLAVWTDVSDSQSVENLASKILDFYNNEIPSVVVHSAGLIRNLRGIEYATEEIFDQTIRVNLKGTFLINRKFALMMKERQIQGSFVNISSINAEGFAPDACYAASKGGMSSMTKSFAKELAKHGIRFNTVRPGPIDTPLGYKANISKEEMKEADKAPSAVPLGRHGTPEEVAEVCLFLASDKSSYVTCSEYEVHGGFHAVMGDTYR